jgi:hypothetical protein
VDFQAAVHGFRDAEYDEIISGVRGERDRGGR